MKICPICNTDYESGDLCPEDGATLIKKTRLDDALIGKVLKDAYRIEEQIGAGGMGAVYRVTQIRLGRSVAVKVLLPKFQSTPEMVRRFFREAQLLSQLNHPNIISIIDFGNTEEGLIYMVMEFLEGRTLDSYVPKGKGLPTVEILEIMKQICAGLTAAHAAPLIHRDLKPANIFLSKIQGKGTLVKILDFGIGKALDDDDGLTQTGLVMGTPGFIAPEQITRSAEPGIPADIYALGGILYFLMSGLSPFSDHTGRSAMSKQLSADPEPVAPTNLAGPEVAAIFPVVLKAMSRQPADRYGSAAAMLMDLKRCMGLSVGEDPNGTTLMLEMESVWSDSDKTELTTANNSPPPAAPQKKNRNKGVIGVVLALILLSIVWFGSQKMFTRSKPLIFGMSADFTGSNRELGRDMQAGILARFNEENASGGLKGSELQLLALDDGYEPEPTRKNMIELLEQRNVFAIIGNVGTPTAEVAVPIAIANQKLFFAPFTGAGFLRRDPPDRYVFNYRASYQQETAAIVRHFVDIKGIPAEAIAVFSQNDSFGDAGFHGVAHTLRQYGIKEEAILHVRYERNRFDVSEAVAGIKANPQRAQAIVTVATYKQAARFISEVKKEIPDTHFSCVSFVGTGALVETFKEDDPDAAEGVIITQVVPFYESNATGVLRYRKALAASSPNLVPSFVSLEGYIAAGILLEALERAPKMETEALIDTLEQIKDLDLGTGSVISFSPSDHQASDKVWAVVLDAQGTIKELSLED